MKTLLRSITEKPDDFKQNIEDIFDPLIVSLVKSVLNEVMKIERTEWIGCGRYERNPNRRDSSNGFHDKDIICKYGTITLSVPETRKGFFPSILQKYARRTIKFDDMIRDLIIRGLSTRDISNHVIDYFGSSISPQGVSLILKKIDYEIEKFHKRDLEDKYLFLYMDGLNVSSKGHTKQNKRVVLAVYGVTKDFDNELIDYMICGGETENNWHNFLEDLFNRGLEGDGVELILHDGKQGLENSISFFYPYKESQLCIFHKMMNVNRDIKDKKENKKSLLNDVSMLYSKSENKKEIENKLSELETKWEIEEPKAIETLKRGFDKTVVYFNLIERLEKNNYLDEEEKKKKKKKILKFIRTNNKIERFFKEIRRRIKLIEGFENDESIDRFFYNLVKYESKRKEDMY